MTGGVCLESDYIFRVRGKQESCGGWLHGNDYRSLSYKRPVSEGYHGRNHLGRHIHSLSVWDPPTPQGIAICDFNNKQHKGNIRRYLKGADIPERFSRTMAACDSRSRTRDLGEGWVENMYAHAGIVSPSDKI